MTAAFDTSFDFSNPQGLAQLRNAGDTPELRRAVAKQFESLFLNLMIRQMRQASSAIEGGLVDNERIEFQQGLFDQQLALSLARGRGIGLADALMRELGGPAPESLAGSSGKALGIAGFDGSGTSAAIAAPALQESRALASGSPQESLALASGSPQDFVAALWPHAEGAARRLGTVPEVLVAQAALETGWGRSLPQNQYGESSLNLFGIKADRNWTGPRAVVATLEYVDGVPERRHEPFRMYRGIGEAFDDYVALLQDKPRYAAALSARSPKAYVEALQSGGYATDPDYARKVLAILERGLPGRGDQVIARRADSLSGDARPVTGAGGDGT